MTDLSRDSVINVIDRGIKEGIRVTIENKCYGSAVILILSGIDTMAYLSMPETQEDVQKTDFIGWVDKYLRFPCKEQLTGLDMYGARCGMLHSYSSNSKLCREGKCRQIGYMDNSRPEIIYDPKKSTELVMVSVEALRNSFFNGVDKFLIDLFSDKKKSLLAEKRFQWLVHSIPYESVQTR